MPTAKKSGTIPKIDIGYRVGHLVVTEKTAQRKNGYNVWRCQCDCGGEILLDTRRLQRGGIQDCGCLTKVKPGQKDLSGQRFGHLVCIKPTEQRSPSGGVLWECQCDCGGICLAAGSQLLHGYKKSCGCISHPQVKDYVGKRFGQLTVLEYAGKRDGMHRWRCLCDCGNETVVGQTLLQSGKTKSCGCIRKNVCLENFKVVDGTSVTLLERMKKQPISSNTSGYNGVYRNRKNGKWAAQITFKGKTYYLGSYEKKEDAVRARRDGEKMHDSFLEWYYSEGNKKEEKKT